MPTCYGLGRRGPTFIIAAAVFLLFFISLHHQVTPRPATRPPLSVNFAVPAQCPTTPPSPPYNRSGYSGFNWRNIDAKYPVPVEEYTSLPHERPAAPLPRIQFDFPPPTPEAETIRLQRLNTIKATFRRGWSSYERYAWKMDELKPVSGGSQNTFGGWGATLADNLDTLLILEMYEEFDRAVTALMDINFNPASSSQSTINVFETTIRYLGGFLAAYDLTGCGDQRLLDKAVQIADMIYASFDTPNRMPVTRWNPHKAAGGEEQFAASQGIIAELASSSLELTRLSQLTGDMRYFDAATRITAVLDAQQSHTNIPGLWPVGVDVKTPDLTHGSTFSFGAMADSAYEYLGKTYQLLLGAGAHAAQYRKLAESALAAGAEHLLFRPMTPDHADILIPTSAHASGPASPANRDASGEHLACFVGGMYALAGRLFANAEHLSLGRRLTDGCVWLYKNAPHGIMPEAFTMAACPSLNECQWDERQESVFTAVRDGRYMLRPEAIESVFYLYRITGEERLRDAAWEMFEAIEAATRTPYANAAVRDVMVDGELARDDNMESFWMAETLKYFYLLFSEPDVISLDEFVLNTEAHPFRLPKTSQY